MSAPRLLHYSSKPVAAVRSCEQGARHRYDKPTGLWVSVEGEDDWRTWCEAESFGNPASQFCYEVRIVPHAKVLWIDSAGALLAFGKKYAMDPYMGPMAGRTCMSHLAIDWVRVAQKHAGIVIAPYQWSLRFDSRVSWYYGWDCASGCIWDASAVASISAVHEPSREVAA